ncbi:Ham1 family protein [Teladorsagia circumcincta]|uniref:Ham1 family protein n=1 Tax=Teladorsagia circumcincta TaxID=45464 RepID=A0A2G9TWH8_TELCI|nr:Ham1 family protein [Teladorsagia circumcincta]
MFRSQCYFLGVAFIFRNIFRLEINYVAPIKHCEGDSQSTGLHIGCVMSRTITFVTGNAGKLAEVRAILSSFEVRAVDVDVDEYQGEPDYVAERKAKEAAEQVQGPILVEDTSLCFNAFKGLPGVYIKWFLKKLGPAGLYQMLGWYRSLANYKKSLTYHVYVTV